MEFFLKYNGLILLLLIIVICTQGCVATSYISSIGAREQYGAIEKDNRTGKVKIYESKAVYNTEKCVASMPYNLCRDDKSNYINEYDFSIIEPHLKSGRVIIVEMQDDKNVKFEEHGLSIYRNDIKIIRRYRKPYGYPIQIFQVIAIPLDFVIVPSYFIGFMIIKDIPLFKK